MGCAQRLAGRRGFLPLGRVLAPPLLPIPGGPDKVAKLFLSVFNGETAVMIFFVISGAVLSACSDAEVDDVCGI